MLGDFMTDLEKHIKTIVQNINIKLQHTKNEKELLLLAYDVKYVLDIILDSYPTIDIPDSFWSILENNFLLPDEDFYNNFISMRHTNLNICSLLDYLPPSIESNSSSEPNYSFDEAIKITQDFFDMYDKDISNYFHSLVQNDCIIQSTLDCYGTTISIFSENISFIFIDKNIGDIILLITLAHETIHSYINSLMYQIDYDERTKLYLNTLNEVYSYFIEFVFASFLHDTYKIDTSQINNNHHNILISCLTDFKELFDELCNLEDDEYNIERYLQAEADVYGIILAHHYYNYYLANPELAKEDLINLMIDSKRYDKHFLLNNYGLNESDLYDHKALLLRK